MEHIFRLNAFVPALVIAAVALSPTISYAVPDQQAIFDLVVNLVPKTEISVQLRSEDVLVRVTDLEQAGLHGFSGNRELIDGEAYVSLTSLAPIVRYELDEANTILRLTVQPTNLSSTVVDLSPYSRPPDLVYSKDTSFFLNYAVSVQDFKQYSLFSELGLSFGNSLLYSSFSRNSSGKSVRGFTNLTIDNPQNMTRLVIGDHVATTDELGGIAFMGGVSYSREFNLDPYFFKSPTSGVSGALLTPSTVDVYVNDSLVRREQLPPGPFRVKDLPLVTGSGATRLVIRDAFGREQQLNHPYYYSAALLAPGLSEFSYNLGFRKNNVSTESWDYGSPVFLARHRFGITDSLTAGFRLEASPNLVSGGASVATRLPLGEVGLTVGASSVDGLQGTAAALSYTYSGKRIGLGMSARTISAHYANLSVNQTDDRAKLELSAFTSLQLSPNISLFGRYAHSNWRDKGSMEDISIGSSIRLSPQANVSLSASRSYHQGGEAATEVYLGFNYSFDVGINTNVSRQVNQGTTTVQIQKPLSAGSGFGYRFQEQVSDRQNNTSALLQYQKPYGLYELNLDRFSGQSSTTLNVSGGIVGIAGKVFLTRPIQGSFALVEVPEVGGVRGYLNNQEVGKTGARGSVLIPNLLPYYGNRLGISAEDVPTNYSIGATERTIAPGYRGGAVVRFPVQKTQAITGNLLVEADGKTQIPSYGQLTVTVDGKPVVSPIGNQGEFYLENLPAGKYATEVEYQGGICHLAIDVPASNEPFIQLGTLHCVLSSEKPKQP